MDRKQADGSTERAHLEVLAKRGDPRAIAALKSPVEFPEPLGTLWDRFQMLSRVRAPGIAGPALVTLTEIKAANDLLQWDLQPHEVEALHLIDMAMLAPEARED